MICFVLLIRWELVIWFPRILVWLNSLMLLNFGVGFGLL